jgi:hypothetical protein
LPKTRTPPECRGAGSREPSCTGWGRLLEGSVRETHGRARGSSWNVRHGKPTRHIPGSQRRSY